ncbi:hypothetical protein [Sedimentitalea todarodis]|uniref:DUF349 domain-containing protein n=1 Tax=Sedimentitalea todarodis TaxID=1631240 RepID=A0ABU3VHB6_9RHOB|nr:hypothetical protein [Sedimentitalea todarodis]MDU9005562.1 hypothetical protein [Sedimentitalea todarodis]
MALGTTTKGTKGRLADMTSGQIEFLEKFILGGKKVEDLTAKTVKKIDKAEKQKIKDYDEYAKKAKSLKDDIEGTIDIDQGRPDVLVGLNDARELAEKGNLVEALELLNALGEFAKSAKAAKAKREKARKELEQKQKKARETKAKNEQKVFKELGKEVAKEHDDQMSEHAEALKKLENSEAKKRVYETIGKLADSRFKAVSDFRSLTEKALIKFADLPPKAVQVPEQGQYEREFDILSKRALGQVKPAEAVDSLDETDPDYATGLQDIRDEMKKIDDEAENLSRQAGIFFKDHKDKIDDIVESVRQALIAQQDEAQAQLVADEVANAKALIQSLISWGNPGANDLKDDLAAIESEGDPRKRLVLLMDFKVLLNAESAKRYGDYEKDYQVVTRRYAKLKQRFQESYLDMALMSGLAEFAQPAIDQLLLASNVMQSRQPNKKNIDMANKVLDGAQKMIEELEDFFAYEQRIQALRSEIKKGLGVKDHRKACPALHAELKDAFSELDKQWPKIGMSAAEKAYKALRDKILTGPDSFAQIAAKIVAWRAAKKTQCAEIEKLRKSLDKKVQDLSSNKKKKTRFAGDALSTFETIKRSMEDEKCDRDQVDKDIEKLLTKLKLWTAVDTSETKKSGVVYDDKGELSAQSSESSKVKMADQVVIRELMADQAKGLSKDAALKERREKVKALIKQCQEDLSVAKGIVKSKKGKSDLKDVQKQISQAKKLYKSEVMDDAQAMLMICQEDILRAMQGLDLRSFKKIPETWDKQFGVLKKAVGDLENAIVGATKKEDEKKLAEDVTKALAEAMKKIDGEVFRSALKTFDKGDHLRAREEMLRGARLIRVILDKDPRLQNADGATPFGPGLSLDAARSMLDDIERKAVVQT